MPCYNIYLLYLRTVNCDERNESWITHSDRKFQDKQEVATHNDLWPNYLVALAEQTPDVAKMQPTVKLSGCPKLFYVTASVSAVVFIYVYLF